jgi:putative membrane protein
MRLGRLADLRLEAERALRNGNTEAERSVVTRLRRALGRRPDLRWAAARFAEHEAGVHDPGDLLRLADRELIAPLDGQARRLILASAKRVSLVTAMSPVPFLAVGFVLVENMRLLRALATLYGGRPGFLGGMKLARMVFVHILATGGVALTDDLIGQLVGQGLAQRLSRRLGEGLFNGALTARIGVAALDICRPMPFVEAAPVRIRDVLAELARRAPIGSPAGSGSSVGGDSASNAGRGPAR